MLLLLSLNFLVRMYHSLHWAPIEQLSVYTSVTNPSHSFIMIYHDNWQFIVVDFSLDFKLPGRREFTLHIFIFFLTEAELPSCIQWIFNTNLLKQYVYTEDHYGHRQNPEQNPSQSCDACHDTQLSVWQTLNENML